MKRTVIASFYTLLAGAFSLLLLAAIVFSCRTGEDPHQTPHSGAVQTPEPTDHMVEAIPSHSASRKAIASTQADHV